jgi:hypothetical protein
MPAPTRSSRCKIYARDRAVAAARRRTTLLLPTGLLCVRVEARDDFGLAAVDLLVSRGDAAPAALPMLAPDAGTAATSAVPTALHEVATLLGPRSAAPGPTAGGDGLLLTVAMRDNRQPQAATELPRRPVQIVDEPQLAAAIARAFRALREDVAQALDLPRTARPASTNCSPGPREPRTSRAAPGVEIGQGRVRSALERAHRGLMRAFDTHLWNRLETSQNAARVVELYVEHSRRQTEPLALDPAFYRDLADRRAQGTLGALERCLDPILAMVRLADDAAGPTAQAVARALAEAQVARDDAERRAALQRVRDGQRRLEQACSSSCCCCRTGTTTRISCRTCARCATVNATCKTDPGPARQVMNMRIGSLRHWSPWLLALAAAAAPAPAQQNRPSRTRRRWSGCAATRKRSCARPSACTG